MKRFLLRLILLLAIASNAAAAPIYQVSINTAALSGFSGYLDFLFLGLATATPAQATVSNLAGDFTGAGQVFGDVAGTAATGVVIGNSTGWNELAVGANFGGLFTFDVEFSVATPVGDGTTLSIALLDNAFSYLGTAADIVTFALQPGAATELTIDGAFAQVSAVPEPSALLMVALGLVLLGLLRLRKPLF
jgi:hypothetical protein